VCDILTQFYGEDAAAKVDEIAAAVIEALPGLRKAEDVNQVIHLEGQLGLYLNHRMTKYEIRAAIPSQYHGLFWPPYNKGEMKIPISALYAAIYNRVPSTTIMEIEYPRPETFQVVRDDTWHKVSPAVAALIGDSGVSRGDLETCRSWIRTFAQPTAGLMKRLSRWDLKSAIELCCELFIGEKTSIDRRAITVAALEEGYRTDSQGNKFNMHFDIKDPWSGINREKTNTLKLYLRRD